MQDSLLAEEKFLEVLSSYEEIDSSNVDLEQIFNKVIKARSISFGKKLRSIRVSKEYSQVGISNYLNIRRATYISWESGSHVPKVANLNALAELLEIDPCELIKGLDVNPSNDKNVGNLNDKKVGNVGSLPMLPPSCLEKTRFMPFLNNFSKE